MVAVFHVPADVELADVVVVDDVVVDGDVSHAVRGN